MQELAESQRHAFLVEKVAGGTVLTPAEKRELDYYESQISEPATAGASRPRKRRRGKVSLAEIRALGLECDSLTEAAAAFGGPGDLLELIERRDSVRAAWERGRLLRNVRHFGRTTISVSQAGKELGMSGIEFRNLLDSDAEVNDLWEQQRRRLRVKMAEAMVAQAEAGRPNALRYVENFLRGEKAPSGFDYEHVPIAVMEAITGKARQTLRAWTLKGGLHRNPDCTYNLADFVPWFEQSIKAQTRSAPREDLLRSAKARRADMDYEEKLGTLLERAAVENGMVARMQNFLAVIENHAGPTAAECVGLPAGAIEGKIRAFCRQLRTALCEIPSELRLPADMADEFERFLGRLKPPAPQEAVDA